MVHSIATSNGVVYAAQGPILESTNGKKAELDLRKVGAAGTNPYLVGIVAETKDVVVLDPNTLEVRAKHTFPKRPSAWTISQETLIVSDKFGDVFSTPLLDEQTREGTNEEGFGSAILGHVSMVLALAANDKYIFSSDRDEHIRVSQFPKSYIIESFLLGHKNFVSHLVLSGDYLLSAGGDSFAIAWDWKNTKEIARLDLGKEGVIAAVIAGTRAYFALEHSSEIISADFPSFENKKVLKENEEVRCLAASGSDVFVGGATSVWKLNSEQEPVLKFTEEESYDLVSEEHLRKR